MNDSHKEAHDIEKQIQGARNLFYGTLKGLQGVLNVPLPRHVYHYTTVEKFLAILKSDSIRLYTVHNFSDKMERKWRFRVEDQVKGAFTDKSTGATEDVGLIIREELSNGHVFIQSNCRDANNRYIWERYADRGAGVCLRLSTGKFIRYLNTHLPDFEHLPDYFKCCYVMYDTVAVEQLLQRVAKILPQSGLNVGHGEMIVWFFYLEYFRNLVKSHDPYAVEKEVRFIVSDNYSFFLKICSIIARLGQFPRTDPQALSSRFHEEYQKRSQAVRQSLRCVTAGEQTFVTVPLHVVVDGVVLGSSCTITKEEVSSLSMRAVRKSQITRSDQRW
jgi:hypothetical protein